MEPTCIPPIACQTFCPSETSPSVIRVRPSVVTTSRGMGGFCRKISEPIQPRTANDNAKMTMKTIQMRFILDPSSRSSVQSQRQQDKLYREGLITVPCSYWQN